MSDGSADPLALAAEFPAASETDWGALVRRVIKDGGLEDLVSQTADGLTLGPVYHGRAQASAMAGRTPGAPWQVMQRVDHPDAAAANAEARHELANGATGLTYVCASTVGANGYGLAADADTLAGVLDEVDLGSGAAIEFNLSPQACDVLRQFAALIKRRNIAPASVDLRAGLDPVGWFAATGQSPQPWSAHARSLSDLANELHALGFRGPCAVGDGRIIHDAGGSEVQELAFAIASAISYLRVFEAGGMTLETARDMIYFRLSADADQFLTTAKFRALRKLWARVEKACGLAPKPVHVSAETAWRMMTRRGPSMNMLRATIAVFAAGVGGADSITVLPHTAALGLPDRFARRLARNTQLILLQEGHLAKVADPGAGSGAFENLTQQLCTTAWSLLQDIEKAGGAWRALETGLIQRKVAEVRAARMEAIAHRKDALIGTSEFPDLEEAPAAVLDVPRVPPPANGAAAVKTEPLPRIRLAEPFERLRDASDRMRAATGARPKVFLATIGKPADVSALETFATNFFASGGIEAAFMSYDDNPPAMAAVYQQSGCKLACLCASPQDLDRDGARVVQALRSVGARHIYAVGAPGLREQAWRAAGIDTFVDKGCNTLAILQAAAIESGAMLTDEPSSSDRQAVVGKR